MWQESRQNTLLKLNRLRIAELLAFQQRSVDAAADRKLTRRLPPLRHGEETQRYLHKFKNEAYRGMSQKTVGCDWTSQLWLKTISLVRDADSHERPLAITKDYEMGDKGGKKDKEKSKKQKADKEGQKTKGKQDKPQSK